MLFHLVRGLVLATLFALAKGFFLICLIRIFNIFHFKTTNWKITDNFYKCKSSENVMFKYSISMT